MALQPAPTQVDHLSRGNRECSIWPGSVRPFPVRPPTGCGQWNAARSYPRKNAPGAGKPTGETPGESLVTGPRAGEVRLPEPVEAVSSDYHRALSARAPSGATQAGQSHPQAPFGAGLGETLPFGSG